MVRVVMSFVINGKIDIAFPWKKQKRREIQDRRRDQHEDKQQQPSRFLVAPSIKIHQAITRYRNRLTASALVRRVFPS